MFSESVRIRPATRLSRRLRRGVAGSFFPFLVAGVCCGLAGQEPGSESEEPLYVTIGLGVGSEASTAAQLALSAGLRFGEITLRSVTLSRGSSTSRSDVALLYGARRVAGRTWLALAAGPAFSMTSYRGECIDRTFLGCASYRTDDHYNPGMAVQAVAAWRRVSLSAAGNFNRHRSFGAITANVHLGKIR